MNVPGRSDDSANRLLSLSVEIQLVVPVRCCPYFAYLLLTVAVVKGTVGKREIKFRAPIPFFFSLASTFPALTPAIVQICKGRKTGRFDRDRAKQTKYHQLVTGSKWFACWLAGSAQTIIVTGDDGGFR